MLGNRERFGSPVPSGTKGIVAEATVIANVADWVCAGELLSFTVRVKLEVPPAVGVPERTPAVETERPAGN